MNRTLITTSVFLALAAVFSGCGGGVDAEAVSASSSEIGDACDRWIMALGAQGPLLDGILAPDRLGALPTRAPVDTRLLDDADRARVFAAYRRACVDVATIDGSTIDAAYIDRCRAALGTMTTADAIPLGCVPPGGTRANGASCATDLQCASLHCAHNGDEQTCGSCAPALRDNDSCMGDCGFGYACDIEFLPGLHSGPMLCVPSGNGIETSGVGSFEACIGVTCASGQFCNTDTNACEPQVGVGAACTTSLQCGEGFICPAGTCVAAKPLGAVCDVDIECATDAYCKPSNPPPGPGGPGVCTAAAKLGDPCDDWYVQCSEPNECYSTCGGPMLCVASFPGLAGPPSAPGTPTQEVGCAIDIVGSATPFCKTCPAYVGEGEACGDDAVCGPRYACVAGTCQFSAEPQCR